MFAAHPARLVKDFRVDPVFANRRGQRPDRLGPAHGVERLRGAATLMPVTLSGCSAFQSFTVTDTAGISRR